MTPRAHRLLVVDDESAIRFALSDYFRDSGWEVDTASEREEAEALLAHTEYEVVIADLRLTGIYGIEGLDIIEWARHLRPETRVVLLTGFGTPEIEEEARRRGADAVLHKPLPLSELERVVSGLVGSGVSEVLRTVCAWCGRIRTGSGEWCRLADAADGHPEDRATHGICTECLERTTPEAAAAP